MQHGQVEENDARAWSRHETLKGATIVAANGAAPVRCLITNLSDEGAELEFDTDTRVPSHFSLSVPHEGIAYRAEVRWREMGRVGVTFHGKVEQPKAHLRAVG